MQQPLRKASNHTALNISKRSPLAYEKAVAALFYKNQQQTEWLQARRQAEQTAKEIAQKERQYYRLQEERQRLEIQLRQEQEQREKNQVLFTSVMGMWKSLNGLPPYEIKLEVPPSAKFNEVAYRTNLRRLSTAQLGAAVLQPPTVPAKPQLAVVTLRQDVLQVKELLARARPPAAGRGRMTVAADFKKKMHK